MTHDPSRSTENTPAPEPALDKNKDSMMPIDLEDFDVAANEDDLGLPSDNELTTKKMDSRRKIEMYWEKKRLQEQLGETGEIDFDF